MTDNNQAQLTDGEDEDDRMMSDSEDERRMTEEEMAEAPYTKGEKRPLDHGVKVRAKVKRGTDTRDQDELLIEGRGESAAEAATDFEAALAEAETREWADRLRALQPGEGEDDE